MARAHPNKFSVFIVTIIASVFFASPIITSAASGVPKILNYQGRLFDQNGNLLGGTGTNYCFRFSIYDAPTPPGGTKLWPASTSSVMTVNVKSGYFSAGVGDVSAGGDALTFDFQNTDTAYLNVEVAKKIDAVCTGPSEVFETLSPRQRIVSSGYAINSLTVGGFTPSQNASSSEIPALTGDALVLGGTNAQVNATSTNTLTLQGGAGTGAIQFFSSANAITSTGTLTIAGPVNASNINQFLRTTSSPTFAGLTLSGIATGSVLFAGTSSAVSANGSAFFWDRTLNSLDIGTSTTNARLTVAGSGTSSAAFALTAEDIQGTALFSVRNDGTVTIGKSGATSTVAGNLSVSGGTALNQTTFTNATGTTLSLNSATSTVLTLTQASSSQYFIQMVDGSGVEQFRVDGNGTVFANGFIAKQMQFSDEFVRTNAALSTAFSGGGTTGFGDTFAWGTGISGTNNCSFGSLANEINGSMRITTTGGTGRACLFYISRAASTREDFLQSANAPTIVMKLRPSAVGAGNLTFAGMMDYTTGVTTDPANGIYFTNASGTQWTGVARTAGVQSSVTCAGSTGTISTSSYAYFRINVNGTSSVDFYIDNVVAGAVNTVYCGTITTNIPTSAMTAEIMNQVRTGGTQPANVDVDFVRINQDDPVPSSASTTDAQMVEPADATSSTDEGFSLDSPIQQFFGFVADLGDSAQQFSAFIGNTMKATIAEVETLFARTINILPGGTITVPEGANQISGRGVLDAGVTEVFVPNTLVTSSSKIIVTPTSETDLPLYINEKSDGQGFSVARSRADNSLVSFDWLIIGSYGTGDANVSVPVSPAPAASPLSDSAPPPPAGASPPEVDAPSISNASSSPPLDNSDSTTTVQAAEQPISTPPFVSTSTVISTSTSD